MNESFWPYSFLSGCSEFSNEKYFWEIYLIHRIYCKIYVFWFYFSIQTTDTNLYPIVIDPNSSLANNNNNNNQIAF